MEAPLSPPRHLKREKAKKKDRKREKRGKSENKKRKRKEGEKHKRKRHKKYKKHKHKKRRVRSSESDSDSSESSGSSSSVDVGALQAMLRKVRGADATAPASTERTRPTPGLTSPPMSSLLSVVPPVSTGHSGGLREEMRVYRPFNATEGTQQGDKDAMGRVLVNGARPALSNLELLDKELHSKEERRS
eukprot:COSAG02_NODE_21577_length_782_cov_1.822840_1_plen_189_part_00